MGRQAIDKEKTGRQILRDRVVQARDTVKGAREGLRQQVDAIRLNCANAPALAMERIRQRFLEVGQKLQANLEPATQLFDERFTKRVERAATAGCRLEARNARIDAEPTIRAGKAAHKAHRETEKIAQQARKQERERKKEANAKIPKAAKMQEVEQEIIAELMSNASTAPLVPVWKRVRVKMYRDAKASEGRLSPLEAFVQYVEANFNEVQNLLVSINAQNDKKLAKEQAAYAKKKARESGDDVPSEAFHVPSGHHPPPKSSVRPTQRGRSAGPQTVVSSR